MPSTLYITSTRQSNPKDLNNSELTNLKEKTPRYQFQNIKYLIPYNVIKDLINQ